MRFYINHLAFVCVVVVAAATFASAQKATFDAALKSGAWCPDCVKNLTDVYTRELSKRIADSAVPNSKCGDGICDLNSFENCKSCASDCGKCKYSAPINRCRNQTHALLTVDDGPSEISGKLVSTMRENNVPFLSFLVGKNMISAIFSNGVPVYRDDSSNHVGTHTFSHVSLATGNFTSSLPPVYLPERVAGQMAVAEEVFAATLGGRRPKLLRAPYLEFSADSLAMVESMGYVPVGVSVDSNDWLMYSQADNQNLPIVQQNIISNVAEGVKAIKSNHGISGGPIVLLHDQDATVAALDGVITTLRESGYHIVDAPTCLGISKDDFFRKTALTSQLESSAKFQNQTASSNQVIQKPAQTQNTLSPDNIAKSNVSAAESTSVSSSAPKAGSFTSHCALAVLLALISFIF